MIQMKNARAKARAMKEKAEREAAATGGAPQGEGEESSKMEISEEEAANAGAGAAADAPPAGSEKRKEHEADEADVAAGPSKKPKYAEDDTPAPAGGDGGAKIGQDAQGEAARAGDAEPDLAAGTKEEAGGPAKPYEEPDVAWSAMTLTKPSPEMRGHTSYLTFATLYPAAIRQEMAA